jgi:hypothetical protein
MKKRFIVILFFIFVSFVSFAQTKRVRINLHPKPLITQYKVDNIKKYEIYNYKRKNNDISVVSKFIIWEIFL